MRRMLIATAAVLFGISGSVLADGPMIRWERIVGVINPQGAANPDVMVAGMPVTRSTAIVDGRVILNLETGFIAIDVKGLSWAGQFGPTALGSAPTAVQRLGSVVCDATRDAGVVVDTPALELVDGSGSFRGVVDPAQLAACRLHPERTVFLLRNGALHPTAPNTVLGYGIGRTIQ